MTSGARRRGLVVLCGCAALGGCAPVSDDAFRQSSRALRERPPEPAPDRGPRAEASCRDPTASLRPRAPLPAPGQAPAGTYMRRIQRRGRLIVGVDQNTVPLAYFNPLTRRLEGFEIDLVKRVARALFGSVRGRVEFKAISTADRISVIRDGSVDLVADALTMTCERSRQVSFSTRYLESRHRVMVLAGSRLTRLEHLRGRRVCAARGTTTIGYIESRLHAIPFPVALRSDCLVALQQRRVAAITTFEMFLQGFALQDPLTRIVGRPYTRDLVGMAIAKSHPEFVRFVNAVLERSFGDGSWARSHRRWLRRVTGASTPAPPIPRYRD